MTGKHIRFNGSGPELEGMLHLPQREAPFPAVIVCHPHPLYGGDMHNSVVLAICHALVESSIAALRFNFRGVGSSEGDYGEGIGEQEDVKSALDFLSSVEGIGNGRTGLAGYSFGSAVALPIALREDVPAIALISPFLSASDWESLKNYIRPKLLICGSDDHLIPSLDIQRITGGLPEPSYCEVIPGADHFWLGYEEEVAKRVSIFFAIALASEV